jgi:proteic killer suppression protein
LTCPCGGDTIAARSTRRGVEQWQLVRLITWRSLVRVQPPQPVFINLRKAAGFSANLRFLIRRRSTFIIIAAINGLSLAIIYIPCYHILMIRSFARTGTEDIFNGINSPAARRTCPENLWKLAARKLDQLDSISTIKELRIPPGNRLEALGGDRIGQYSIHINVQYRICFFWTDQSPDQVEIVDYH